MEAGQVIRILKEDALGRVERIEIAGRDGVRAAIRRVACGGRVPGSRWLAQVLLARERRALRALAGVAGVPQVVEDDRGATRAREVLVRTWIEGSPLHEAQHLPEDFFDHLDGLVLALHARGVCHNDLHKEQNVLVGADGFPHLVDFQLASVHRRRSWVQAGRVRDDLRHVEKHRRRYTRFGRGPLARPEGTRGRGHALRRTWLAVVWRRTVKPLYVFVTRRLLATRDGEARRASSGPWPQWRPAVGPRGPS